MRKFFVAFYCFLEHPVTHIVFGFLVMAFAWFMAYEIGYDLDAYSFVVGGFASAGYGCLDLGFQKLRNLKLSK